MTEPARILLVDDDFSYIETMVALLEPYFEVSFATSGARALQVLRTGVLPDVVVLAVEMEDMPGFEVCRRVKQDPKLSQLSIMFITKDPNPEAEILALSLGGFDYVAKDMDPLVLLARVRVQIEIRHSYGEVDQLNRRFMNSLMEIRRSEERNQVLVTAMQYSPASVMITDANSRIEYVNPKYIELTGYIRQELLGQTPVELRETNARSKEMESLRQAIQDGKYWQGELVHRSRSGRTYWTETHVAPVKNTEGVLSHFVSIQTDVTDRHKADIQLHEAREREQKFNAAIQHELLFGEVPSELAGYDLACFSAASQIVDGDFYTVSSMSEDEFEVLVGDVMGKGITAALVGAGVKNAYREAYACLLMSNRNVRMPTVTDVVNQMHALLISKLMGLGVFVTLTLMRFNRKTETVTLVNAGHTPTMILRDNAGRIEELLGNNLPMGILEDEVYEEAQAFLNAGDMVAVFSDGLTDACNAAGEDFGLDRVRATLLIAAEAHQDTAGVLDRVQSELMAFTLEEPLKDDTSLILIKAPNR